MIVGEIQEKDHINEVAQEKDQIVDVAQEIDCIGEVAHESDQIVDAVCPDEKSIHLPIDENIDRVSDENSIDL